MIILLAIKVCILIDFGILVGPYKWVHHYNEIYTWVLTVFILFSSCCSMLNCMWRSISYHFTYDKYNRAWTSFICTPVRTQCKSLSCTESFHQDKSTRWWKSILITINRTYKCYDNKCDGLRTNLSDDGRNLKNNAM